MKQILFTIFIALSLMLSSYALEAAQAAQAVRVAQVAQVAQVARRWWRRWFYSNSTGGYDKDLNSIWRQNEDYNEALGMLENMFTKIPKPGWLEFNRLHK